MAKAISKDSLRGFILQDPRINTGSINDQFTTVKQGFLTPGVPAYLGTSGSMKLLALGKPYTADSQLYIRTLQGGLPNGRTSTFCWRDQNSGDFFGQDQPHVWTNFHRSVTGASAFLTPSLTYLRDNEGILFAGSKAISNQRSVNIRKWTRSTEIVTEIGDVDTQNVGTTSGFRLSPNLVTLSSGRILLFYYYHNISTTTTEIRMRYSDDNGATWTVGAGNVLPDPINRSTVTLSNFKVAYGNDQILLIFEEIISGTKKLQQYVSNDLGCNFTYVGEVDRSIENLHTSAICFSSDFFHLVCLNGNDNTAIYMRLSSANSAFNSVSRVFLGVEAQFLLTIVGDDRGVLHVYSDDSASGDYERTYGRSLDNGVTWSYGSSVLSSPTFRPWSGKGALPMSGSAIYHEGMVWMATNQIPSTNAGSLNILTFGGASNLTWPAEMSNLQSNAWQVRPASGWFGATNITDAYPADHAGVGPSSVTFQNDGSVEVVVGSATVAVWSDAAAANSNFEPQLMLASMNVTAGTGSINIQSDNTTDLTQCSLRVTADGVLQLFDGQNSNIFATASNVTGRNEYMLFVNGQRAQGWWRPHQLGPVREWNSIGSTSTLTTGPSEGFNSGSFVVRADSTAKIWWMKNARNATTSPMTQELYNFNNPIELTGYSYSSVYPTYVSGGISILGYGSVSMYPDEWLHKVDSLYPLRNICLDYSTSPREEFRTADDSANQDIAFTYNVDQSVQDAGMLSDTMGIHLRNINFPDYAIDLFDSTAAVWNEIGYVNNKYEQAGVTNLWFVRRGNMLKPASAGNFNFGNYISRDELRDGYFKENASHTRKITHNTEGYWVRTGKDNKHVTIFCQDVTSSDPLSGLQGEIWYPNSTAIIALQPQQSGSALRIRLAPSSSNLSAEGYWKIGQMVVGPVVVPGWTWSQEHTDELESNNELIELPDGKRFTINRGKSRKIKTINFNEVDITRARDSSDIDDYLFINTNSSPIANRHDAPIMMEGLFKQLEGSHTPLVFVPHIPANRTGSLPDVINLKGLENSGSFYGRITSAFQRDIVLGEEMKSEVMRVGNITIEEEL